MNRQTLKLGSRGSKLALWQAEWVKGLLEEKHPDLVVEIVIIVSSGDQDRTRPLEQLGGEGLFTRELEDRLAVGAIDLAVHSLKDLPTVLPTGFRLAAVPPRGAVEDALVTRDGGDLERLATGATVATGSPRRKAQLLHLRPDLNIVGIRGNVPTRLRKLDEENLDGTILARAGMERLGFADRMTQIFPPDLFYPAVGQGAVGVEVRDGDEETTAIVAAINHPRTHSAVNAERGFLAGLGSGCSLPVGAHALVDDAADPAFLTLSGVALDRQGKERLQASMSGPLAQSWALGQRLADLLIGQGAEKMLEPES